MKNVTVILSLVVMSSLTAATIDWRRQGGNFSSASPQTEWSASNRVVWSSEMPKWSNGTPLIIGEKIIVTAEPDIVLCIGKDGKILWQKSASYDGIMTAEEREKLPEDRAGAEPFEKELKALTRALAKKRQEIIAKDKAAKANPDDEEKKKALADARSEIPALNEKIAACKANLDGFPLAAKYRMPEAHPANGYTSNTPAFDGTNIYILFGSGVGASFTLDGVQRWIRLIDKTVNEWGQSGSPVIAGGSLIVQFTNMFALDLSSGAVKWRSPHVHYWGTPAVVRTGGIDVLFTDGGEIVSALDGKTLSTNGLRSEFGSPLAIGNIVYVASADHAAAFSIEVNAGVITPVKLWQTGVAKERYYATPLIHDGLMYIINQTSVFTVLDAATGEKCYEQKLSGMGATIFPSPVIAGNVVIVSSENGRSAILAPGREYKELARAAIDPFRSTPVCDGARMYIRCANEKGVSRLYCIGE
ncbi:MAG: PQQ-binding-like beta-propeller repeat protein [Spirochaetota bacterium]